MAEDKKSDKKAGGKAKPAAKPSAAYQGGQDAKSAKQAKAAPPAPKGEKGEANKPHAPARFKDVYRNEIAPALRQQFGYKSPMEVPRITKVVLNMGVGEETSDKKILENAVADMTKTSGQ